MTRYPHQMQESHKKGNSNTDERIQLINRFIELFGVEKLALLRLVWVADHSALTQVVMGSPDLTTKEKSAAESTYPPQGRRW